MSLSSLCRGDIVVVQNRTETVGAMFGRSVSWSDGARLDALVQQPSAREVKDYEARGQAIDHVVFFSTDAQLQPKHLLKWTVRGKQPLSTPIYLRVLTYRSEGRPGGQMLWIAACEFLSTREEA